MSNGFLTVTPNAAIDVTYLLGCLTPGRINRAAEVLPQPGGKGNNVARVLARLGAPVVATGFGGGASGDAIEAGLRAQGVEPAFVRVAGETRRCLTIIERDSGRTTEIREPGPPLSHQDLERLVDHVANLALDGGTVVISGSMPPGLPPDAAATLVRTARETGAFIALDASGDVLRAGMTSRPGLIKPNLEELEDLIGPTPDPVAAVQQQIIGPVLDHDAVVLLSLGADGAVLIRKEVAYQARPPRIVPVNTVGCGDALLAGFLSANAKGHSDHVAMAFAVAVGTAAALQTAVAVVDMNDVARIAEDVCITPIGASSKPDGPDDLVRRDVQHVDRMIEPGAHR